MEGMQSSFAGAAEKKFRPHLKFLNMPLAIVDYHVPPPSYEFEYYPQTAQFPSSLLVLTNLCINFHCRDFEMF